MLTASLCAPCGRAVDAPARLSSPPGIQDGEILLAQLNCTSCHGADAATRGRIGARPGPLLGTGGLRLTPQWLRSWLTRHEVTQPNTAMPDLLHAATESERADVADSLVHFLVSIQPAGDAEGLGADPARIRLGGQLYHSLGCVACHAPAERPEGTSADSLARAASQAVPLVGLAHKYPAGELVRFLRDPVSFHPAGRMPSLNLSVAESMAITSYLLREQAPELTNTNAPRKAIPGLKWDYYEAAFGSCAEFDQHAPKESGESGTLVTTMAKRDQNFGLRFSGVLEIATKGEYSFWSTSDDGSVLDLDGRRVVENDGVHPPAQKRGRITLEPGPHTFEFRFFQNGGGSEFKVEWAGPGIRRQAIPPELFRHYGQPLVPLGTENFAVDPERARRGRDQFARLNCAACHGGTDVPARAARPLVELAANASGGCLADAPPPNAPKYALGTEARTALRRTVENARELSSTVPAEVQARLTLARLNCYACHQRDGFGGPASSGRDPWFSVLGGADLGDEGRIPPHLEAVGGKLRREWLETLLFTGRKVRPYMATRMPLFGEENVKALPAAFEHADVKPDAEPEPELTAREGKYGRKLVGRDGLSCITCHTFTTYGSLGIPALNLEHMYERLRWDWVRRYLPNPAELRPGTRMPTFWPEGHAVNTDILNGDTTQQLRAIFAWMKDGAKADVPSGLTRSRRELVVEKEAVIYRNFLEGAGSRAIGVGYPERANLAFDANDLRLALLWQGGFIDTARHSSDRGVGFEAPLGDHVVRLPAGPAFAILESPTAAWPKTTAPRRAGQRFRGYTLDALRRPEFHYSLGEVQIDDQCLPKAADVDITLVRTLTLTGSAPSGSWWFRAAAGEIRRQADGSFMLNGKVRLKLVGAGEPVIAGDELRVPISVPGRIVEEITW